MSDRIDRAEAAGYAEGWASRADQLATDYRLTATAQNAAYAVRDEPENLAHTARLRDQAAQMALVWAAVAALGNPAATAEAVGECPRCGCIDPQCDRCITDCAQPPQAEPASPRRHNGCPTWDRGEKHPAHMWTPGGTRMHYCNGNPPASRPEPVPVVLPRRSPANTCRRLAKQVMDLDDTDTAFSHLDIAVALEQLANRLDRLDKTTATGAASNAADGMAPP